MNADYEYSLYWIRLEEHIDINSQGYVGISNNPNRRLKEHKKYDSNKNALYNALKKYGDKIIFEIIYENLSLDEAKTAEYRLRPKQRIGWNIAVGGGIPPNNKGKIRKDHSEAMKGENNPFYGKTHSEETKLMLSEMKKGNKNPFFGKKRPNHSKIMKEKSGINYPKFKGYFVTPFGKFSSYKEACDTIGITVSSLYNYCIVSNDKVISAKSYGQSKFIRNHLDKEQAIGKTYKEIGFGFEYV